MNNVFHGFAIGAVALVSLCGMNKASAQLPQAAVFDQTFLVIHLDATAFSVDDVSARIGELGLDQMPHVTDTLKEFAEMHQGFAEAGGRQAVLTMGMTDPNDPDPQVAIGLIGASPGDPDKLERWINSLHKEMAESKKKHACNMLLIGDPHHAFPAPSIERHGVMSAGLKQAGNAPLRIVFIPTQTLTTELTRQFNRARMPKMAKIMLTPLIQAKGMYLLLDMKPKLTMTLSAQMADEATATNYKQVLDGTIQAFAMQFKQQVEQADAGADTRMAQSLVALLEQLKVQQNGAMLTFQADGPMVQLAAAAVAPALQQARDRARQAVVAVHMKQLAVAVHIYSADHDGRLPPAMADLKPYLGNWDKMTRHPVTGEQPGFIYARPADTMGQVPNPSQAVLFFEARNGQINPQGWKAYCDGHVSRDP